MNRRDFFGITGLGIIGAAVPQKKQLQPTAFEISNRDVYKNIKPRTAGHAVTMMLQRGQHQLVVERFGRKTWGTARIRKFRRY